MTRRTSLLSAVLAIGTLAALPALAEGTASSPVPPAPTETSVKTPATQASTDAHADIKTGTHKEKVTKSKKSHEQVANKPGTAMQSGTGTDGKSEPAKQ